MNFLLSILSSLISALAFMFLWNWYVAPLGAHYLTFITAWGIRLTVLVITRGVPKNREELNDVDTSEVSLYTIIQSLIMLGLGAIPQLFM